VSVDLDEVFRQGGARLIGLLDYCVFSVRMEPVFAFLVREYRSIPTPPRALALYDAFCAPGAPARLKADDALPLKDLRIRRVIEPVRQQWAQAQAPAGGEEEGPARPANPANYLFDFIIARLKEDPDGSLQAVARQFDPSRTPLENLPGGKMSPGQRAFLEKVWQPRVRPCLVAAGFWRIANVGG
jgi:hypothetical protein